MFVKFSKLFFEIKVGTVENWSEVEIELKVRKAKQDQKKKESILLILKNRKQVKELIKKSDKELKKELAEIPKLCYDRGGTFRTHSPFKIMRNTH